MILAPLRIISANKSLLILNLFINPPSADSRHLNAVLRLIVLAPLSTEIQPFIGRTGLEGFVVEHIDRNISTSLFISINGNIIIDICKIYTF